MSAPNSLDHLLIERVRAGDAGAWSELIARFEGRLLAFVESRTRNRAAAEDVVQETLLGFLTSLPNYDARRPLESYLFSIAAHKLTDHLRREGRRPAVPLSGRSSGGDEPAGPGRKPSSIARSGERKGLEEEALAEATADLLDAWRRRGDWAKIECVELLLVAGTPNKDAAALLGVSEQTVANIKFEFISKVRAALRAQRLPEDVFPELHQ